MKKIKYFTLLLLLILGFTTQAKVLPGKNDSKFEKNITEASTRLGVVIEELNRTLENVKAELEEAEKYYNQYINRQLQKAGAAPTPQMSLDEYVGKFFSLTDFYNASLNDEDLTAIFAESPDSELKNTYLLILAMEGSLHAPYDEVTNNEFISQSKIHKQVLPQHQKDFEILVSQINDYNFYMYELARMFEAYQNQPRDAETLVKEEDAQYLLNVPYTAKMLKRYVNSRGQLPSQYKAELYKSAPDAFYQFKN